MGGSKALNGDVMFERSFDELFLMNLQYSVYRYIAYT